MTDDLKIWQLSSESEDEVGNGWSTFISKKKKYMPKEKIIQDTAMSSLHLSDFLNSKWHAEVQPTGWIVEKELLAQEGWIIVKRKGRMSLQSLTQKINHVDKKKLSQQY